VQRATIEAVKLYSLALNIAPLTGKSSKIAAVFSKEEKMFYKMVCYTLYFGSVNCQLKADVSEKGSAL